MNQFLGAILGALLLTACTLEPSGVRSVASGSTDAAVTATGSATETAILDVLMAQSEAWNRGDIPGFMEHYWKDDELRFGSGGSITRGWQATLDRYLRRYSSREQMGQLDFSDLEVSPLADDAAIVHGRWKLERAEDTPSGLFTLVFRNFGAGWVIVSDTTTLGSR